MLHVKACTGTQEGAWPNYYPLDIFYSCLTTTRGLKDNLSFASLAGGQLKPLELCVSAPPSSTVCQTDKSWELSYSLQWESTHPPTDRANRSKEEKKQNYTAKADDNPHARARATAMTQPAGEKKKKVSSVEREQQLVETLHLRGTSRQRSPAAPALTSPPYTHTERRGERERGTAPRTTTKKKKKFVEGGKTKAWGEKKTRLKPTNLFHPPRRVQTDSILDLGRFQGESVRHVHTQHCHVSGRLPPLTAACLSAVRVSRKIFSGRTVVLLGFVFFSCRESGAPRLNFCCSCCGKPARRSDWSKNFVTRSYLFGVSAVRHLAKAKDNTAAQQLRIH